MDKNWDYMIESVAINEIVFGESKAYYHQWNEKGVLQKIDFSRFYMLITGLNKQICSSYFDVDTFEYGDQFWLAEQESKRLFKIQNVMHMSTRLLYDHTKRCMLIFSTPENVSANDVAEIVASCFNRLYARIFDMSKTPYRNYTVLSEEIHGYENLHQAFREIDALSRQQYFDMRTMVMTPSLLEKTRIPADPEQIHEDLTQMYVAMRAGGAEEMIIKYRAVMAQLEAARDFDLLADSLSSMRASLEGWLRSHGREVGEDCRDVFAIEKHPTFQIQRDEIERYLLSCMESFGDSRPMSQLIQEAVRYIRHHYAEDIAVSDIAEHIGMSQSWLTKRFKQECGVNIVGYLLDVRIQRAKALLAQTDMLIMEIACATGFDNPGYFISVFRRAVGMTPKAYRDEAQEKNAGQP